MLDAALQEVENIPAYLPNCLQLKDVVTKAKKWLNEAEMLQVKHCFTIDLKWVRFCFFLNKNGFLVLRWGDESPCWTASLSWFSERTASRWGSTCWADWRLWSATCRAGRRAQRKHSYWKTPPCRSSRLRDFGVRFCANVLPTCS